MPDFTGRYPDLRLDMRISDSVVDLVEGGFDVAVRYAELKDSSFIAKRIAPDRRVLVASPRYVERHGAPRSPEELDAHRCLVVGTLDLWTFRNAAGEVFAKRVTPACASRKIKMLHASPTKARLRAIGQGFSEIFLLSILF